MAVDIDGVNSTISTDKLIPQSGTALQIGDASDVITIPASATITNLGTATGFGGGGKVLQVVNTTKTDTFTGSHTSWTDITGLSVTTGTLASTSSKVIVMCHVIGGSPETGGAHCRMKVVDGSGADITNFIGDAALTRIRGTSGEMYGAGISSDYFMKQFSCCLEDLPSSLLAQTYKIQVLSQGAQPFYVNRDHGYADSPNRTVSVSSITAWEIGA